MAIPYWIATTLVWFAAIRPEELGPAWTGLLVSLAGTLAWQLGRPRDRRAWLWLPYTLGLALACAWYVDVRGPMFMAELALPTLAAMLILVTLARGRAEGGGVA